MMKIVLFFILMALSVPALATTKEPRRPASFSKIKEMKALSKKAETVFLEAANAGHVNDDISEKFKGVCKDSKACVPPKIPTEFKREDIYVVPFGTYEDSARVLGEDSLEFSYLVFWNFEYSKQGDSYGDSIAFYVLVSKGRTARPRVVKINLPLDE